MTASDNNPRRRPAIARDRKPLSLSILAALLAIVVAACVTLVAPLAWATLMSLPADQLSITDCTAVAPDGERLACYDRLDADRLQQPAKGAFAPRPQ